MMKYVYSGVLTLLFVGVVLVPSVHAETTTSVTAMLEQIKTLMAKVEELKKQLATAQGEVRAVIKDGLKEGMTDDDIKKLQELLATDATIYPEGMVTGYFGPLTKEALKRFQSRHELEVTGTIDETTRNLLEEYLKERFGEKIPPGLLKAPGIAKKIELRIKENCDKSGNGKALFCEKLKVKYEDKKDKSGTHEEKNKKGKPDTHHEDAENQFDVAVAIEDGDTTVSFTFKGTSYTVTVESITQSDVLEAVAKKLKTTATKMNRDLRNEIKHELEHALEEDTDEDAD